MNIEIIHYRGQRFPAVEVEYREVRESEDNGSISLVSAEELNVILEHDSNAKDKSIAIEARRCDERIAFFIPEEIFNLSEAEILARISEDFPEFIFKIA